MGYSTYYYVKFIDGNEPNTLREYLDANEGDYYELIDVIEDVGEPMKWYDHESDMLSISKVFPEVVFELSGEGEEAEDVWRKYFKDGKIQRCPAKITFDAYDESKLSESGAK